VDIEQPANRRAEMVERQLRARGIRNEAVLEVMGRLPRERFVGEELWSRAYDDEALPIAGGQTISQPYMVGRMTELLDPHPGIRVLEVGTGSGYQAAVLGALGCRVTSIERRGELAEAAGHLLAELGLADLVAIEVGDGSLERPDDEPFDAILVTAAAPRIPPALPGQLVVGGRLVAPVGRRDLQELVLIVRGPEGFQSFNCGPCVFVPLVGRDGFEWAPTDLLDRLL
jgi:protein-L-isoaspartate(D-aspartate) O-methyltransferase